MVMLSSPPPRINTLPPSTQLKLKQIVASVTVSVEEFNNMNTDLSWRQAVRDNLVQQLALAIYEKVNFEYIEDIETHSYIVSGKIKIDSP